MIGLSRHYAALNGITEVLDTILHEIAHALCRAGEGHGAEWRAKCLVVGAKPVRCYGSNVVMPKGKWSAKCPGCGAVFHRHRVPKANNRYHTRCGPVRGSIKFIKGDE